MNYIQNTLRARFQDQLDHRALMHNLDTLRHEFKRPEDIHALRQAYEEDNLWGHHTLGDVVDQASDSFEWFHTYYADTIRLAESVKGGNVAELWDVLTDMASELDILHEVANIMSEGGFDEGFHIKTNRLVNLVSYYSCHTASRCQMYTAIELLFGEFNIKLKIA